MNLLKLLEGLALFLNPHLVASQPKLNNRCITRLCFLAQ